MVFFLLQLSAGLRESASTYDVVYLVMAVLGPFFALIVGISFAVFMYRWMHKKRLRELNTNDEEYAQHAPHDLRAVPAGDSTLKVCAFLLFLFPPSRPLFRIGGKQTYKSNHHKYFV